MNEVGAVKKLAHTAKNNGSQVAKETSPDGRRRLQLDFSEKAYEKLNKLKIKADLKTNAEVVRNALRLYEWFLDQGDAKIHVVKGNETKEVELIF